MKLQEFVRMAEAIVMAASTSDLDPEIEAMVDEGSLVLIIDGDPVVEIPIAETEPEMVLYTENMCGNVHSSASTINDRGWAKYLVSVEFNSGNYSVAVFRMPATLVREIKAGRA